MCLKDFLVKEYILHASRNTPLIQLDGVAIQTYPDISPATLDKRRTMKEVTPVLQSARIRYRWGLPFKHSVPHNGTTYTATNLFKDKDLLVKLGLLDPHITLRLTSTPPQTPIWASPSPQRGRRNKQQSRNRVACSPLV